MKKLLILTVLLLALVSAEDITLNKAVSLAQNKYPTLTTNAQSIPNYPVEIDGTSYWVVEFDNVWVPITKSTSEIITDEELSKRVYKLHYLLQKVSTERNKEDYPTKQTTTLSLMSGDVDSRIAFLEANKDQLPESIQEDADALILKATQLKTSISDSVDLMNKVSAMENKILSVTAKETDATIWRNEFRSLLGSMDDIVTKGYAYEDERAKFIKTANAFSEGNNSVSEIQKTNSYASGTAINNVPGSLPGLETTIQKWKLSWLQTGVSATKVSEDASLYYSYYSELLAQENIVEIQSEANEKVQEVENQAPAILSRLQYCVEELSVSKRKIYDGLEENYGKAKQSYLDGRDKYIAFDYENALTDYQNARDYADNALENIKELKSTKCPTQTPVKTNPTDIIYGFIFSPLGMIVVGLFLALIGLMWWNSKKEDSNEKTDYY